MKVFTLYDGSDTAPQDQARMIKLWMVSWKRNGWTPRLLTERTMGDYQPRACAWSPRLNGLFVPSNVINFGLKRRPKYWGDVFPDPLDVFDTVASVLSDPRWR